MSRLYRRYRAILSRAPWLVKISLASDMLLSFTKVILESVSTMYSKDIDYFFEFQKEAHKGVAVYIFGVRLRSYATANSCRSRYAGRRERWREHRRKHVAIIISTPTRLEVSKIRITRRRKRGHSIIRGAKFAPRTKVATPSRCLDDSPSPTASLPRDIHDYNSLMLALKNSYIYYLLEPITILRLVE